MEIIQLVLSVKLRNEIYESCVLKRTNKFKTHHSSFNFVHACLQFGRCFDETC